MKIRNLDPRAQQAIDLQRARPSEWVGPILFHNLPAVLPKKGERRCWGDAVTVFLMSKLAGVHRVPAGTPPYWRGVMYQVERNDLAKEFDCDPDEISSSLSWLEQLGLIHRQPHTRIDACGKPCGTDVFVAPRMDRLKMLLDYFAEKGRAMTASQVMDSAPLQGSLKSPSTAVELALTDGSTRSQGGAYLNCAKPQQKPYAESSVEASAQRPERPVEDDRRRREAAGGGGDAEKVTQVPRPKSTLRSKPASPRNGTDRNGQLPGAPPARWQGPPPPEDLGILDDAANGAWAETALFGELWAQAMMRNGHAKTCKLTARDLKTAFDFFHSNPQTGGFYTTAVGINAWRANEKYEKSSGWDKLRHCRTALDVQAFLRSVRAGKIESEIGQLNWEINAYEDLRMRFTQSELQYYGWERCPMLPIEADRLWENCAWAADYYSKRNLPLPPEVFQAEELRTLHDTAPN